MITQGSRIKTDSILFLTVLLILMTVSNAPLRAQLATSLFLYNSYDYDFHDSRGNALGRTEITSVNGANAIFLNPANIVLNKRVEFSFNGIASDLTKDVEHIEGGWGPTRTQTSSSILDRSSISQLAVVFRLTPKRSSVSISIGIGYSKGLDFDYSVESKKIPPSLSVIDSSKFSVLGGLNLVTLGGAILVESGHSIGVSYGFSVNPNVSTLFESYQNDERSYTVINEKVSSEVFTFSSNFVLSDRVSVGAIYKKSSDMIVEERTLEVRNFLRPVTFLELGDETYQLPGVFGIGIQYDISDKLVFVVESKYKRYSGFSKTTFRTGVEYNSAVSLRIGAFRDPKPIRTFLVEGSSKAAYGVTAGAGIELANINANMYALISKTTLGFDTVDGIFLHRNTVITAGFSLIASI